MRIPFLTTTRGAFVLLQSTWLLVQAAREIPVLNGVSGGVPLRKSISASSSTEQPSPESALQTLARTGYANTPGKLRIKSENSGVCETTPGVYQATGYGDLSETDSVWFWYFAARNNPSTAPLVLWINGGPGTSSMIGIFEELGPCRIDNTSTTVSQNPYTWTTNANILFIDQPVGVGWSYTGSVQNIGTSERAAVDVWKFLQIFFGDPKFAALGGRSFGLFAESYGGHYGPVFAKYFLDQNAAISAGTLSGIPINLKVLGLGNGLTDALLQYPGYITYSANNPYQPLVPTSVVDTANTSWSTAGGCRDQILACYNGGSNDVCSAAQGYCNAKIINPLYGNYFPYYIPSFSNSSDAQYPADITKYLKSIQSTIGAEKTWSETNINVYTVFASSGDWMRNARPQLESVVASGVKVVVYAGDADFMCNYLGIESLLDSLATPYRSQYTSQTFSTYTVRGNAAGLYKSAGGGAISYLRIFGAGHESPAYRYGDLAAGEVTLQMFNQVMLGEGLVPT